MGNSRKPASTDLPVRVASILRNTSGDHLCLGLSGGLDSVVLLDVLIAIRAQLGITLSCVHVNHQLSANAQAWEDFCARLCAERGIALALERVQVGPTTQLGLEAAARRARYQAYARQDADAIVLAHHRDDQVETVLLRLLRGAGATGLAGMRVERTLQRLAQTGYAASATMKVLRPLLDVERAQLRRYAEERQLRWIEDEANASLRHDRNFLRHEILPRIATRFPAYAGNVARAARHLAETGELLDELAAEDLARVATNHKLSLAALRALSPARAHLALRYFLKRETGESPSSARSREVLRQLLGARPDARVRLEWRQLVLHCFQDFAWRERAGQRGQIAATLQATWQGEQHLDLGEFGTLTFQDSAGQGLSAAKLRGAEVTVRLRRGGERLQLAARGPHRTLKNLLREAEIPPWQRQRLPLLWCGEQLAWVAGIGADHSFRAAAQEPGLEVTWQAPAFRSPAR